MNILVTGATGFIGSKLVDTLRKEHVIFLLVRRNQENEDFDNDKRNVYKPHYTVNKNTGKNEVIMIIVEKNTPRETCLQARSMIFILSFSGIL